MGKSRASSLGRGDWISGARKLLIRAGISNVKVEPLAKALNVTTGSFYWHFKSRDELHEALLEDWINTNTKPFFEAVGRVGADPRSQYLAFFGVWVLERGFDPAYDRSIRDWARTSKKVARVIQEVDHNRIELLRRIFENFGYQGLEAEMRARVTYYHQVGYYALNVKEPRELRLKLAPYYADILTGIRWLHALESVEEIREGMRGNAPFKDDYRQTWPLAERPPSTLSPGDEIP